jgi:hypothetical protein
MIENAYLPEPYRGLTDEQLVERYPYEFRFRDPKFEVKYDRFFKAIEVWREVWATLPMTTPYLFNDEDCPDYPEAREFVAARKEYLDDLRQRKLVEDQDPGRPLGDADFQMYARTGEF